MPARRRHAPLLVQSLSVPRQPRRDRRSSLMWPLKVRVGANSPSLCPTMPSVTKTGTCLRPSCTAIACPSMSGMIVERRDQVRMTFLVPLSFWTSTFLSRWSSTNGPFFRLRGMSVELLYPACSALLVGAPAAHDEGVAGLATTRPALRLALRVARVPATGGLALTTTVRVVDRVHGHTTDGRALALPPHPAGLAPVDVRLVGVADLADGGAAAHVDATDLAGRHTQRGVRALATEQLDAGPGRTGDLRPAAR